MQKTNKRLTSVILILVMIISMMPVSFATNGEDNETNVSVQESVTTSVYKNESDVEPETNIEAIVEATEENTVDNSSMYGRGRALLADNEPVPTVRVSSPTSTYKIEGPDRTDIIYTTYVQYSKYLKYSLMKETKEGIYIKDAGSKITSISGAGSENFEISDDGQTIKCINFENVPTGSIYLTIKLVSDNCVDGIEKNVEIIKQEIPTTSSPTIIGPDVLEKGANGNYKLLNFDLYSSWSDPSKSTKIEIIGTDDVEINGFGYGNDTINMRLKYESFETDNKTFTLKFSNPNGKEVSKEITIKNPKPTIEGPGEITIGEMAKYTHNINDKNLQWKIKRPDQIGYSDLIVGDKGGDYKEYQRIVAITADPNATNNLNGLTFDLQLGYKTSHFESSIDKVWVTKKIKIVKPPASIDQIGHNIPQTVTMGSSEDKTIGVKLDAYKNNQEVDDPSLSYNVKVSEGAEFCIVNNNDFDITIKKNIPNNFIISGEISCDQYPEISAPFSIKVIKPILSFKQGPDHIIKIGNNIIDATSNKFSALLNDGSTTINTDPNKIKYSIEGDSKGLTINEYTGEVTIPNGVEFKQQDTFKLIIVAKVLYDKETFIARSEFGVQVTPPPKPHRIEVFPVGEILLNQDEAKDIQVTYAVYDKEGAVIENFEGDVSMSVIDKPSEVNADVDQHILYIPSSTKDNTTFKYNIILDGYGNINKEGTITIRRKPPTSVDVNATIPVITKEDVTFTATLTEEYSKGTVIGDIDNYHVKIIEGNNFLSFDEETKVFTISHEATNDSKIVVEFKHKRDGNISTTLDKVVRRFKGPKFEPVLLTEGGQIQFSWDLSEEERGLLTSMEGVLKVVEKYGENGTKKIIGNDTLISQSSTQKIYSKSFIIGSGKIPQDHRVVEYTLKLTTKDGAILEYSQRYNMDFGLPFSLKENDLAHSSILKLKIDEIPEENRDNLYYYIFSVPEDSDNPWDLKKAGKLDNKTIKTNVLFKGVYYLVIEDIDGGNKFGIDHFNILEEGEYKIDIVEIDTDTDDDDDDDNNNSSSGGSHSSGGSGSSKKSSTTKSESAKKDKEDIKKSIESSPEKQDAEIEVNQDGNKDKVATIAKEAVKELVKAKKDLTVKNKEVKVTISKDILKKLEVKEKHALDIKINKVEKKVEKVVEKSKELKPVKGTVVEFEMNKVSLEEKTNGNQESKIEKVSEPVAVTIKLTPEQIKDKNTNKLTAVIVKDGVPVKLGGTFNPKDNTFTFHTNETAEYSVAEAKQIRRINLTVNDDIAVDENKPVKLDVAPKINNDSRTMVPLRFIAEALGSQVEWNQEDQKITLDDGKLKLSLTIGVKSEGLDTPPVIENGRTLVPLRYVSEQLGANVLWHPSKKKIEIVK